MVPNTSHDRSQRGLWGSGGEGDGRWAANRVDGGDGCSPLSSRGAHAHGKRAAARPPAKSQRTGKSAARDWKIALHEFDDASTVWQQTVIPPISTTPSTFSLHNGISI